MQIDGLRVRRAGAVALAAVVLAAGVSLDAAAYGGAGEIRLQLGGFNPANRWIYTAPDGTSLVETISVATGKTAIAKKCQYSTDGTATRNVADLKAIVGGSTAPNPDNQSATSTTPIIGLGVDSIGVYDNSIGVSCYRMSESLVEGLRFEIGSSVPAQYFDRLELDMEVKGDAAFDLTIEAPRGLTTYHLRSGGSINPTVGSAGESFFGSDSSQTFNCLPASDSGPDSAGNDNCRWIINDVGSSFELKAVNNNVASSDGAGSLEGGGDYGSLESALRNNTVVYLANLSETGDLTCDRVGTVPPSADNLTGFVGGGSTALCRVTRIDPTGLGYPWYCDKPFPYKLSTELLEDACNFDQFSDEPGFVRDFTQPMSALVEVVYPARPRTDMAVPPERTRVQFAYPQTSGTCGDGNSPVDGVCLTGFFYPERCEGTVVDDDNLNDTIAEVYDWPMFTGHGTWLHPIVDQAVQTPAVLDWACIIDTGTRYVGSDLQQQRDVVAYWGDARFSLD